jgi:RluA family pseudouridine synthase
MPVAEADAAFVRSLVIYADSSLIAFNKPSGLPVQTRNPDDQTLDRLMAAFARSNGKRPRLVHRLDAQTSGVIIAAQTQPAAAALSKAFAGREAQKTYLALVSGPAPEAAEGEISHELARYAARPGLELMRAARPGDQHSQSALTRWRRLASAGGLHLLEIRPLTGRMHQIRVHLSLNGWPILGDPYYGGAGGLASGGRARLMLHAAQLILPHPGRAGQICLEAPAPDDFLAVLSAAGACRSGLRARLGL